jgi:hypothetical protein
MAMKLRALIVVGFVLAGCSTQVPPTPISTASLSVQIQPPSTSPFPLAVVCGPLSDEADCADGALAMDAVFVIPPGARAVIGGTDQRPTIAIYGSTGELFSAILLRNPAGHWSAADYRTYP